MKTKKISMRYVGMFIAFLFIVSCGYRFSGMQKAPFGIQYISVLMFENKTSEIGMESVLANQVISEVTRDSRMTLSKPDQADAVLTGVIQFMEIETISRTRGYAATERRVIISVDVQLKDNHKNLLWSGKDIRANEAYIVAEDKLVTEYHRKLAISEVARKIAQNIYLQLNHDF